MAFTMSLSRAAIPSIRSNFEKLSISQNTSSFQGNAQVVRRDTVTFPLTNKGRDSLQVVATTKLSSASISDVAQFQRSDKDTGSPEVQIALCTSRIVSLTEHLKINRKDYSTQRGLLKVLGQRKRLLRYLQKSNKAAYDNIVEKLNIRVKNMAL
eukprot:CAMPEP_0196570776 /NCGR_PEP_ID=MMETSP1081-20130531/945_1 /TAXON_ID=36882 /ORGANISM="Pyramimonas amylifera, Strain CCMP720" /LENGTH=153 /DNA_ID=CAMNT_0041887417 /DNA_START=70 /DNA_END=531 /DNA_ORIENTATION=-